MRVTSLVTALVSLVCCPASSLAAGLHHSKQQHQLSLEPVKSTSSDMKLELGHDRKAVHALKKLDDICAMCDDFLSNKPEGGDNTATGDLHNSGSGSRQLLESQAPNEEYTIATYPPTPVGMNNLPVPDEAILNPNRVLKVGVDAEPPYSFVRNLKADGSFIVDGGFVVELWEKIAVEMRLTYKYVNITGMDLKTMKEETDLLVDGRTQSLASEAGMVFDYSQSFWFTGVDIIYAKKQTQSMAVLLVMSFFHPSDSQVFVKVLAMVLASGLMFYIFEIRLTKYLLKKKRRKEREEREKEEAEIDENEGYTDLEEAGDSKTMGTKDGSEKDRPDEEDEEDEAEEGSDDEYDERWNEETRVCPQIGMHDVDRFLRWVDPIFRYSCEGAYWSMATISTVGFGDVTTRTKCGKIYATIWVFLSLLVSMWIQASMTLSMTNDDMKQDVSNLSQVYDKKVGVVQANSMTYFAEVTGLVDLNEVTVYKNTKLLVDALTVEEVDVGFTFADIAGYYRQNPKYASKILVSKLDMDQTGLTFAFNKDLEPTLKSAISKKAISPHILDPLLKRWFGTSDFVVPARAITYM